MTDAERDELWLQQVEKDEQARAAMREEVERRFRLAHEQNERVIELLGKILVAVNDSRLGV